MSESDKSDTSNDNESLNQEGSLNKDVTKHYFLDTCSLMLNPLGIFRLASCPVPEDIITQKRFNNIADVLDNTDIGPGHHVPNNIYISEIVEWELNDIKDRIKEDPSTIRMALDAGNTLARIKEYGAKKGESLISGITLPNGSKIFSIPHDKVKFDKEYAKVYEPTRDDRILFDYFSIPKTKKKGLKSLVSRLSQALFPRSSDPTKIEIPNDAFIEVVTEDNNFRGKVFDMNGKKNFNFSCRPLTFERTKHPDPSQQYTGEYPRPMIMSANDFFDLSGYVKEAISAKKKSNSKKLIPREMLLDKVQNTSDFKSLDDIVANQFVAVQASDGSGMLYLRHLSNDIFEPLYYASAFIDEEFSRKSSVRAYDQKKKHFEYTQDKNKLRKLIKQNISGTVRNNLFQKVDQASEPNDFLELHEFMNGYMNSSAAITHPKKGYSRDDVLHTQFNPIVIPEYEQILFLEYLNDPSIGLASIKAPQGAGKTIFALESGLRQVRLGLYDKIMYLRPVVVTGEDTGFKPGKQEEKIRPFMTSCDDALAKIYCTSESSEFYTQYPSCKIMDPTAFLNAISNSGIIQYEVMTYMAGRTLSRSFVIMDEAHLLTRDQLKMLIGRIGESSKLILLGDFAQLEAANADVVRKYHLTLDKLGMSHLIEKVLVNNNKHYTDIYGHVSINRPYTKRSRVASIANVL